MAVASYNTNTVEVLMGNGDGTFANLPTAATPLLSPSGGTYVSSVVVTLTDSSPGATIYYTTDGSTPTTASTQYTGPISVTQITTIRAIAVAPDYAPSAVASATYTIQVAIPTFSVPAGTYSQPQSVTLSDTTSGATIYYTTDGSTPTTSSTRYTGAIAVTRTTTVKAMAAKAGMVDSAVATATYTLQAAAPTFNPPGGSYTLPQFVEISDSSPGVTIYYTHDHAQGDRGRPRLVSEPGGQRDIYVPIGTVEATDTRPAPLVSCRMTSQTRRPGTVLTRRSR